MKNAVIPFISLFVFAGMSFAQFDEIYKTQLEKAMLPIAVQDFDLKGPVSSLTRTEYYYVNGEKTGLYRNSKYSSTKIRFNKNGHIVSMTYFLVGEPTGETGDIGEVVEEKYVYKNKKLVKVILLQKMSYNSAFIGDSAILDNESLIYEATYEKGELKKIKKQDSEYDFKDGQLIEAKEYNNGNGLSNEYTFSDGLLRSINWYQFTSSPKHRDQYYYDTLGNNFLITRTYFNSNGLVGKTDSIIMNYYNKNRFIKKFEPDYLITNITYLQDENKLTIISKSEPLTDSYANSAYNEEVYDARGLLIMQKYKYHTSPLNIKMYTYNPDSSLQSYYYEVGGDTMEYKLYNEKGSIMIEYYFVKLQTQKGIVKEVIKTTYEYNNSGLLVKKTRKKDTIDWFKEEITYKYDRYNNVVEELNTFSSSKQQTKSVITIADITYFE